MSNMNREQLLKKIQTYYRSERLFHIDKDFLIFEEEMSSLSDLETILVALDKKMQLPNPHNSCLLYCTGLTTEFNSIKERCDTEGGSPPDIDIDFEAEGRDKAVELVASEWGRDNVANIITHGTLKPKSLTRRYFKLSTPDDPIKAFAHSALMKEVLEKIPEPLFGKDATLEETIKGDQEKGRPPRPELTTDTKYADWYKFASSLEDMIANFGIHAAGIVISEFPIYQQIPMWANSKAERITQYDMKEVESLGLIKFDFLSINNLDILKECVRLVNTRHGKNYSIYNIPDGDVKAYQVLNSGLVQGIFQMETSKTAKELITEIQPISIEDLSDISALNRPGPLQYAHEYVTNKRMAKPPEGLPKLIADIIKETHYILLYQEQVMKICTDIAGYTLREADDIRRAMGKKKLEVLVPYKESFIKGCVRSGISEEYATTYWDKTLLPFADYSFNKSHSVTYSFITYLCAYFKANYPTEFFCALMTIRSRVMQPKLWAEKAPEYIQEAKNLSVNINSPSVQTSDIGFTIIGSDVYFGLNGIRSVGATASKNIIRARNGGKFKDIWDFLARVDQRVINTKVLEALIVAGAFDTLGYCRGELLEKLSDIANYLPALQEWHEHEQARKTRDEENARVETLRAELDEKLKLAKKVTKDLKKANQVIPEELSLLLNLKETFELITSALARENVDLQDLGIPDKAIDLYERYGKLRKLPALKEKEKPVQPELKRYKELKITVEELMAQADYIGCYLGVHPARVLYGQSTAIAALTEGEYQDTAGQVTNIKVVKTKRNEDMAFITINDGTSSAELVLFSRPYKNLLTKNSIPSIGDIIRVSGKVEEIEPVIKIKADNLILHRRKDGNM